MKSIEERYRLHRLKRPDAAPWDKVIDYMLNGNGFGGKLTNKELGFVMKVNKNTVTLWRPLIANYIMDSAILNESVADDIVISHTPKHSKH